MKVHELIEILKTMPQDANVQFEIDEIEKLRKIAGLFEAGDWSRLKAIRDDFANDWENAPIGVADCYDRCIDLLDRLLEAAKLAEELTKLQ